jgi:hypothetical protein
MGHLLGVHEREQLGLPLQEGGLPRLRSFQLPLECCDETCERQDGWSVLPTSSRRCVVSHRVVVPCCLRRCTLERTAGPEQRSGLYGAVGSRVKRLSCRAPSTVLRAAPVMRAIRQKVAWRRATVDQDIETSRWSLWKPHPLSSIHQRVRLGVLMHSVQVHDLLCRL